MYKILVTLLILISTPFIKVIGQSSLVSISPNSGYTGQTLTTTVTGSGWFFTQGSAPSTFGDFYMKQNSNYIYPNNVTILNDDELDVEWSIPPNHPIGNYIVRWDVLPQFLIYYDVPGGFDVYLSRVNGTVYYDEDSSLTQNGNENGIFNRKMILYPDSTYAFTGTNGNYELACNPGTKTVEVVPGPNWIVTTDTTQTVSVTGTVVNGVDFGLRGLTNVADIEVTLGAVTFPRCFWDGRYAITYVNNGTVTSEGSVTLTLSNSITYSNAYPAPSNITSNVYTWDYDTLYPGEVRSIFVDIVYPGGGTLINNNVVATAQDIATGTLTDSDYYPFSHSTACSYDPNDKTVNPPGELTPHYTLYNDTLDYLIRFQNTGNDTAFKVVILDTLDAQILDISTFSLITYSHPMDVELKPSGALSFTFNNILLPDSNVNEPASHGWIHFSIIPKQGIPLPAVLENTAYIYFDLNTPVQTNTTLNTLVLQIPTGLAEPPVNNGVTLMPNPASENVEFILSEYRAGLELKIYSASGKLIHMSTITSSKYKVDLENVSPGVLFYHISHPSGTHDLYGKFVVTD